MFSNHAKKRAQQRGVKLYMCRLLRWHGDLIDAGNGTVLRYFSKQARRRLSALFGSQFLAANHEKLRAFLIEERISGAVITVGKLYPNRRLRRSTVKRGRLSRSEKSVTAVTLPSRTTDKRTYS